MKPECDAAKPSWSDAPAWAEWLACDFSGRWYWFEIEPHIDPDYHEESDDNDSNSMVWINHQGTEFDYAHAIADEDWAADNWKETLEQRPSKQIEINQPDKHKRVTLFIEFEDSVNHDDELAAGIADAFQEYADGLEVALGTRPIRTRIAVGTTKLAEVYWDFGYKVKLVDLSKIDAEQKKTETASNKPAWSSAPAWANWLACDRSGMWVWYKNKPEISHSGNMWNVYVGDPSMCKAGDSLLAWALDHWTESLEQRPDKTSDEIAVKPDWSDAPIFYNFLAQDYDGTWWWYAEKPHFNNSSKKWAISSNEKAVYSKVVSERHIDYDTYIEQRPIKEAA